MYKPLFSLLVAAALASGTLADTIELADGDLLEGKFVGMSNGIMMFDTGSGIQAFPEDQVVAIYNSEGVATREAAQKQEAAPAAAKPAPAPPPPREVTAPAGTRLVIRMAETVDSRRHKAGHRFRGQLESALTAGGKTIAPRGTLVYGRVANSRSGGRAVGSSEMTLEFTDIMINDQMYPVVTTGLQTQTQNEAGRTAGRTARAAVIGGLIDGSSGAKTGAKVGAGASILTGGSSINVPSGTLLEAKLGQPLTVEL